MRFFVVSAAALGREPDLALRLPRLVRPRARSSRRRSRSCSSMPLNFVGNKLWSFRALRLLARRSLAALALAPARRRGDDRHDRSPARRRSASATPAEADEEQATRDLPRRPQGRRLAGALPAEPDHRRDVRRTALDGQRLVGRRPARSRPGRSTTTRGVVTEAWTGPQVAWTMARGVAGRVRRHEDQQLPGLARLLRAVPARARRLAAARSRCGTSTCSCCSRSPSRSGSSTAATCSRRAARLPGARSSCSRRCVWIGAARPRAAARRRSGRSGCSPRAAVFLGGFRDRPELRAVERDRRRLLGRDRRRADLARPEPVRPLPGRGRPAGLRPGRLVRRDPRPHPDERALRVGEPARATRTARSPTRPTCPATGSSAGAGKWDTCPAAHFDRDRVGPDLPARPRRSSAGASAATGSRRRSRSRGSAWPFTQYVSNSNTNDAIMPALLVWGFCFVDVAGRARRVRGARRRGRSSRRCSSLPLWSGYPEARRPRPIVRFARRLRGRDRALAFCGPAARAVAAPRGARLLRPHVRARRSTATRRSRSGTGASTTRRASPTCTSSSSVLEGLLVVGALALALVAAPPLAAPARRADRGAC